MTKLTPTELLLRDSIAIEGAKTDREYSYIVGNIEARHARDGISPMDKAVWESVKRQHAERILRVALA